MDNTRPARVEIDLQLLQLARKIAQKRNGNGEMFSGVLRAVTELEQCAKLMRVSTKLELVDVKLIRSEL